MKSNVTLTSECISATIGSDDNSSVSTNASKVVNVTNAKLKNHEGFEWTEYEQSLVLGAFFWLHWLTQIPGGVLANRFGAKLVFGLGNFIGILLCFFIPTVSLLSYKWLIVLRIVQGFIAGTCWPAMHSMTAKWIPPNERSKFVTAYLGNSVGVGLFYPLYGIVMDLWSWKYVFYISGIMGTVWYAAWYFLAFDSPSEHPRISNNEKKHILNSLGKSVSKRPTAVPWRHLITSVPVWLNVWAQFGSLWAMFTVVTHAPSYLKLIHGWNVTTTGFLSGLPYFGRILFAYVFSILGDYLMTRDKLSRLNVRKLATLVSSFGQGLCMIGLAYSGCNSLMAITFLSVAITIHGAVSTGPLANLVDLSPNYASVLMGMANGFGAVGGMISPLIVGLLTNNKQTTEQWQKVFWIGATILMTTSTVFALFGKCELQWWNNPQHKYEDVASETELRTLNKNEKKRKGEEE
ncbi:hypothetical protein FQA39_LY05473 [Lamprigera yunnana]|nr:hypothetical protein FQA39_LY05473 [Lamprigera yunnana]